MKKLAFLVVLFVGLLAASSAPADPAALFADVSPRLLTAEEAAALPPVTGTLELRADSRLLPRDTASGIYFIPQSSGTPAFEGRVQASPAEGYTFALYSESFPAKEDALLESALFTLYAIADDHCLSASFIFTSLPVLTVETAHPDLTDETDTPGHLTVVSMESGVFAWVESPLLIHVRGNTSQWFPKKSFRLSLVDTNGSKRHLSIAGLRKDDDWILNPMYSDTSKIREKLAYELWEAMNTRGSATASSRMAYGELILNGAYWGLYGIQERIDNKQVDGSKAIDILYKIATNDAPTAEELLTCEDPSLCRAFEIQHPEDFGGRMIQRWIPAAVYMAVLDGQSLQANCSLSLENAIDYGLWAMVTQAHDCHYKNQFLNCVYDHGAYTMYKIPWDVNNTFGDVWENDAKSANYTEYRMASLVKDGLFKVMIEAEDPMINQAIKARWHTLREWLLTPEVLCARAEALHLSIFAAAQRDSLRWPSCGMGEGNALNVLDVTGFIEAILPRVDAFVSSLP